MTSLKSAFRKLPLNEATANKITPKIYPAGSARKLNLPGKTHDWRIDFWQGCLDACDPKAKGALFQLARSKKYFKAGKAGAIASTVSGAVAIGGGVGCMVAGAGLTATGVLAPVGIALFVGGAVGTGVGVAATTGGVTSFVANRKVKKEERARNKQVDEEIEEGLEGPTEEIQESLEGSTEDIQESLEGAREETEAN